MRLWGIVIAVSLVIISRTDRLMAPERRPACTNGATGWRHRWLILRRIVSILFLVAIVVLGLVWARSVNWEGVFAAMKRLRPSVLAIAAVLSASSYLVYSCVDLFARPYIRNWASWRRTMAVAFASYAFNLNLGAWVGSIGLRYRLYSRLGVDPGNIARIIGLSFITNWSGYFLVAGIAFVLHFTALPASWNIGDRWMRISGALLLVALLLYVGLCAFSKRRTMALLGKEVTFPPIYIALLQITVSSANWLLSAGILFVLLRTWADFPTVLTTFLLSAIAGAAAHIPAGLGVIEGVFFAVLGRTIPYEELLAALLAYRAIYYLAPMLAGAIAFLALETSTRHANTAAETRRTDCAAKESRLDYCTHDAKSKNS
jgi:uncharacterized membrane protein YbhN (UPF0104 family)